MRRVVPAVILLLAACGSTGRASHRPPTATSSSAAAAAPTTATLVPAVAVAGEEDWLAIMRALMARRDDAYGLADPGLLDQVYDPACPCLERNLRAVVDAREAGLHDEGSRYVVERAELFRRVNDELVIVRAVGSNGPAAQVNRRGRVVRSLPPQPPTRWIYTLARAANAWRIIDVVREGAA